MITTDNQIDRTVGLRERVREIMADTFGMEPSELPNSTSQETCGKWSSLYHMMLLVVLEEQFEVSLSMDDMTSMTSLAEVVAVLDRYGATA